MKTTKRLMLFGWAAIIVVVFLISSPIQANMPKKVLLIPFTLYASDDLAYLQKGISQMLISRLTQQDQVEVLQVTPEDAKGLDPIKKARDMGVDYVVTGSLTLLGKSVSTDAKVMAMEENKQVMTFSRVGKDQAAIIDHVDQLAAQMNVTLFGAEPAPSTASVAPVKESDASIYQHPEKLITQPPENDQSISEETTEIFQASLKMRGRRVSFQMRGVTVGDVDGDGRNDVVCIGPSSVMYYGIKQKQFVKKAEIKSKGGHYVSVDAVDVNGNGKAEIFVTNFFKINSQVSSFVLEWDGKKLVRIADNLRWYFKAVKIPDRGTILAGQRQGIDTPFASTIHEMGGQGGVYAPLERLPLPKGLQIYGFAYGTIRSPHDTDVAVYNSGGFVRILDSKGKEQWATSERYGGSHLFLKFSDKSDASSSDYVYLSPRIHLYDMDKDGLQEIFVIDNENIAGAFKRVRLFKNGRLLGLKWDQLGMTPKWRTRSLSKYISDFALADLDGDGAPEAVATIVQQAGGALSKAHSYLVVFNLPKSK